MRFHCHCGNCNLYFKIENYVVVQCNRKYLKKCKFLKKDQLYGKCNTKNDEIEFSINYSTDPDKVSEQKSSKKCCKIDYLSFKILSKSQERQ